MNPHSTSFVAGLGSTAMLWLPSVNPVLQCVLAIMSIIWIGRQLYLSKGK